MSGDPRMLAWALAYARLGWRVFPCAGKKPLTTHGFKDATTDVQVIREWWTRRPDSNIAEATGEWDFVLDRDDLDALADLERTHGALLDTWRVLTGGGGVHDRFAPDPRVGCSSGALPDGIDVRGHGGYAILPPSI